MMGRTDTSDALAHRQAGLTLVEMIVALALGALVIGFLAQGTSLIRGFGRLGTVVSVDDETLAVRDHLRDTIASALAGDKGPQRSGFAGVGDTAVFTVPGDRLLESGAPVRITLAALSDGGRMSLVETRAPPSGGGDARNRTRRLVAGALAVTFSYFGALSGDAAPSWADEWTDPEGSPTLVRIDVRFPPGDKRHWPPFVVRMPTARAPAPSTAASQAPAMAGNP